MYGILIGADADSSGGDLHDDVHVLTRPRAVVVCHGHQASARAAQVAAWAIADHARNNADLPTMTVLDGAIRRAGGRLRDAGRLGASVVAAVFEDKRMLVAHIGGAQIWRLRGRRFVRLTTPHTAEHAMRQMGRKIPSGPHPLGGILRRVLGMEGDEPEQQWIDVQVGDRLLVCSGAIPQGMDPLRLHEVMASARGCQAACKHIVQTALAAENSASAAACVVHITADPTHRPAHVAFSPPPQWVTWKP